MFQPGVNVEGKSPLIDWLHGMFCLLNGPRKRHGRIVVLQLIALGRLNPQVPETWLVLVSEPEWQIVGSAPYPYECTEVQASQAH